MLTDKQAIAIKEWVKEELPDDYDKLDVDSELDYSLTVSENRNALQDKISHLKGINAKEAYDTYKHREEAEKRLSWQANGASQWREVYSNPDIKAVCVVGQSGSGKTALLYDIGTNSGLDAYYYKHPKPELLRGTGIQPLSTGVKENGKAKLLLMDEAHQHFPTHTNKNVAELISLFTFCRQKNVKIAVATSDTRWIVARIEPYIDAYAIKDCDPDLVKRGSKIKSILEEHRKFGWSLQEEFRLEKSQFLLYSRTMPEVTGLHSFTLPGFWTEKYSKPYGN